MTEELTITQLQQYSSDQLVKKHVDLKEQLARLRFDVGQGKLKGVHQIGHVRRTIARLLTVLNQKKGA